MRVQLTTRVEPHTADWLARLAGQARAHTGIQISVNQVAAAILERAEEEGWTVDAARPTAAPPTSGGGSPSTPPAAVRDSMTRGETWQGIYAPKGEQ